MKRLTLLCKPFSAFKYPLGQTEGVDIMRSLLLFLLLCFQELLPSSDG